MKRLPQLAPLCGVATRSTSSKEKVKPSNATNIKMVGLSYPQFNRAPPMPLD